MGRGHCTFLCTTCRGGIYVFGRLYKKLTFKLSLWHELPSLFHTTYQSPAGKKFFKIPTNFLEQSAVQCLSELLANEILDNKSYLQNYFKDYIKDVTRKGQLSRQKFLLAVMRYGLKNPYTKYASQKYILIPKLD